MLLDRKKMLAAFVLLVFTWIALAMWPTASHSNTDFIQLSTKAPAMSTFRTELETPLPTPANPPPASQKKKKKTPKKTPSPSTEAPHTAEPAPETPGPTKAPSKKKVNKAKKTEVPTPSPPEPTPAPPKKQKKGNKAKKTEVPTPSPPEPTPAPPEKKQKKVNKAKKTEVPTPSPPEPTPAPPKKQKKGDKAKKTGVPTPSPPEPTPAPSQEEAKGEEGKAKQKEETEAPDSVPTSGPAKEEKETAESTPVPEPTPSPLDSPPPRKRSIPKKSTDRGLETIPTAKRRMKKNAKRTWIRGPHPPDPAPFREKPLCCNKPDCVGQSNYKERCEGGDEAGFFKCPDFNRCPAGWKLRAGRCVAPRDGCRFCANGCPLPHDGVWGRVCEVTWYCTSNCTGRQADGKVNQFPYLARVAPGVKEVMEYNLLHGLVDAVTPKGYIGSRKLRRNTGVLLVSLPSGYKELPVLSVAGLGARVYVTESTKNFRREIEENGFADRVEEVGELGEESTHFDKKVDVIRVYKATKKALTWVKSYMVSNEVTMLAINAVGVDVAGLVEWGSENGYRTFVDADVHGTTSTGSDDLGLPVDIHVKGEITPATDAGWTADAQCNVIMVRYHAVSPLEQWPQKHMARLEGEDTAKLVGKKKGKKKGKQDKVCCLRDFYAPCPEGWTRKGKEKLSILAPGMGIGTSDGKAVVCVPPESYNGTCTGEQTLPHSLNQRRLTWGLRCQVEWPCLQWAAEQSQCSPRCYFSQEADDETKCNGFLHVVTQLPTTPTADHLDALQCLLRHPSVAFVHLLQQELPSGNEDEFLADIFGTSTDLDPCGKILITKAGRPLRFRDAVRYINNNSNLKRQAVLLVPPGVSVGDGFNVTAVQAAFPNYNMVLALTPYGDPMCVDPIPGASRVTDCRVADIYTATNSYLFRAPLPTELEAEAEETSSCLPVDVDFKMGEVGADMIFVEMLRVHGVELHNRCGAFRVRSHQCSTAEPPPSSEALSRSRIGSSAMWRSFPLPVKEGRREW